MVVVNDLNFSVIALSNRYGAHYLRLLTASNHIIAPIKLVCRAVSLSFSSYLAYSNGKS